jgi:hypothetical protein
MAGYSDTFTEPVRIGDWLKGEMDHPKDYDRESVTILASQGDLKTGTVMGKITSGGKYVPMDTDASNGSQNAAGILLYDIPDSADDQKAAVIVRGPVLVYASKLTWRDSTSSGEKTTALAQLATLGIRAVLEA